ncbi:MAG: hypothetical protein ABJA67_16960 [Chthonomonadales bacterium]
MSRMVGSTRRRQSNGLGERFSEIIIFIAIGIGLLFAGRWYFVVYKHSPSVALVNYVAAIKSGDTEAQYGLLSIKTKKIYPDKDSYTSKWKVAEKLAGKMGDFNVSNMVENGDKAEADVSLGVRKDSTSLISVSADSFTDHYILRKENDGWKIALDECYDKIKSRAAAEKY